MVDPSPEAQKALDDEIEKVNKSFGSSATAEFPAFTFAGKFVRQSKMLKIFKPIIYFKILFTEPKLDSIFTEKLEKVSH